MSFDLHTHSNRSDGAFPPAQVVHAARDAGLEGIALTDHDTLDGYDEARAEGERIGVEVIRGLELSTVSRGASVHMLGYFVEPSSAALAEQLELHRDDRIWRAKAMVARLNELGVAVTFERVREIAKGESVGRPHIAAAMVELGVVPNTTAAFTEEWIANRGRAYVERHTLSPHDAIPLIRGAGGAAVIAHAIWTENDGSLDDAEWESLVTAGLTGIEVDHPDHDAEHRARYAALAHRFDLIATGASDWHGNEHGGKIGENTTDRATVDRLRERAGRP
jgi:3',5'-nucleoside bisphosphate phosphatase